MSYRLLSIVESQGAFVTTYDIPYTGACPFSGGGPAQKIAEKMIFSTKKVAKYM